MTSSTSIAMTSIAVIGACECNRQVLISPICGRVPPLVHVCFCARAVICTEAPKVRMPYYLRDHHTKAAQRRCQPQRPSSTGGEGIT